MAGIAMLLLCSCDAENSISTKYPCQFYFKSQYHPGTSLETALNGTGVYTMVSAKKVNGAWNIYSTLNDGKNQITQTQLQNFELVVSSILSILFHLFLKYQDN